ncbi:unnamed protein product [Allacma fusca]|uniref:Uncharacterized protein n=1 Tax=Allacma fusca TaxID=39272 RepID=A0A8J2PCX3_9HEXA|nr:unnamed protein product [Allacma fusca]
MFLYFLPSSLCPHLNRSQNYLHLEILLLEKTDQCMQLTLAFRSWNCGSALQLTTKQLQILRPNYGDCDGNSEVERRLNIISTLSTTTVQFGEENNAIIIAKKALLKLEKNCALIQNPIRNQGPVEVMRFVDFGI